MRNRRRFHEGFLGVRGIPEITLQIKHYGSRDLGGVDISRHQFLRRAEIGVHRALAIRGHHDVGAAGRRAIRRSSRLERNARGADVVRVQPADLVIPDLADIGGARAQIGDADNRVGRRPAGHLGRRPHVLVDCRGAGLVDQRHTAFGHAVAAEEAFVCLYQHVENRIADPENVVFR